MTVRSKLLADFVTTTSFVTVYTVPAGKTAILKWVTSNHPGAVGNNTLLMTQNSSGSFRSWFQITQAATTVIGSATYLVLPAGTAVRANSGVAGMQVTISGVELEGVAP